MNLFSLYEKMETLVGKLPQPLQSPILREIRPLKTLFLHQRSPRILLLGDRGASRSAVVNALFSSGVAQASEDYLQDSGWQLFASERGKLRLVDGRRPLPTASLRRALTEEAPDVAVYLYMEPAQPEESAADVQQATDLLHTVEEKFPGRQVPVLAVAVGGALGGNPEGARRHLDELLHRAGSLGWAERVKGVYALQAAELSQLASSLAGEMPDEAKLEFVRLAGIKEVQRELAQGVVRSMSAICGAVGAQPIPLADFPVLTALQAAMVAGIMHIAGGELSVKQGGKWLAAVGANIGLGLVLREGARAALKLIPIWGDLVSGGVAAAGTYAIGQAAIAYFVDGVTLGRARELFRTSKGRSAPKSLGS